MDPGIGAGGPLIHYTRRLRLRKSQLLSFKSLNHLLIPNTPPMYLYHTTDLNRSCPLYVSWLQSPLVVGANSHTPKHCGSLRFSFCITSMVFAANLVGMHHMLTALWAASNRVGATVAHTGRALAHSIRTSWGDLGERSQHGEAAAASQQRAQAIVTTGTSAFHGKGAKWSKLSGGQLHWPTGGGTVRGTWRSCCG